MDKYFKVVINVNCLLIIFMLNYNALSQNLSTIANVRLNLPCKLELDLEHSQVKSYRCQVSASGNSASYRITVRDFSTQFQSYSKDERRAFVTTYLYKIQHDESFNNKSVKIKMFNNLTAVQYDYTDNGEGKTLTARTFVFFYKNNSITLNFIATNDSFDKRFEQFLTKISLIP
jgi:hypothetical protein